ncbi:hypothetical protein [Herbiconiux sp. VKM Ac-2851]|uniref:hypothetical protein n=1 Tax=Herbiconiux sp. VKM Ac-2851 TaxID=2739025 RepID=UPI00156634E1|nr:hypothetical protein [Herbiconiux sp. VKM Ac-2851]NQX34699.1 hypothetical protein [Herbiconiux sp. VKM Ac-2851]
MNDTSWTREALIARTDVAFALDHVRRPVTPERARLRLEYFRVVSAVTSGSMTSQAATVRFEQMLTEI